MKIDLLRSMSLAAQRWITEQQRAGVTLPDSGYVLVYMGQAFAWCAEVPPADRVMPGTIVVPITLAGAFLQAEESGGCTAAAGSWVKIS